MSYSITTWQVETVMGICTRNGRGLQDLQTDSARSHVWLYLCGHLKCSALNLLLSSQMLHFWCSQLKKKKQPNKRKNKTLLCWNLLFSLSPKYNIFKIHQWLFGYFMCTLPDAAFHFNSILRQSFPQTQPSPTLNNMTVLKPLILKPPHIWPVSTQL